MVRLFTKYYQLRISDTVVHTLIKLRITLSLAIALQNQLIVRFIDVTLDGSQKYLLHLALNYEIISLSFLTQFPLSL